MIGYRERRIRCSVQEQIKCFKVFSYENQSMTWKEDLPRKQVSNLRESWSRLGTKKDETPNKR